MTGSPFFFREEKNQVYYHDFKVFIFGTDITPWITSQVSLQKADRDGINSLSFSLSNAMQAFEITSTNLGLDDPSTFYNDLGQPQTVNAAGNVNRAGTFRLTDPYSVNGRYSELAKAKIYTLKKQVNGTKRNIQYKVQSLGPVTGGNGAKINSITNENSNNATSEVTDRYPFSIGSLVFHKYDPVRFFVKNPLVREDDQWTCEFTGYLDTKPYSQNYLTGESVCNITCQDIRLLMQHMRVQVNPCAQVSNENIAFFGAKGAVFTPQDTVTMDNGLFNDFIVHRGVSHVLGQMSWLGSIQFLIFGLPVPGGGTRGGIGKLKNGLTYKYDVNDFNKSNMLEKWNNIINFGVSPLPVNADVAPLVPEGSDEANPNNFSLLPTSASESSMAPGTYLTKTQVYALGTATVPDQLGSPDATKVHFLLPAEGTPLQNMIEWTVQDTGPVARVEFQSRYDLICQLLKTLDYQLYVSGMGDIIVEFPMYDFQPTDYNEAYNSLYTFYNHVTTDNVNDEGGAPISALEVTSTRLEAFLKNAAEEVGQAPIGTDRELRQTVFSSVMASRFGPMMETYNVPGVTDPGRLIRLGYIEFNKRLAAFNLFDFNAAYRPYISVNRPIFHVRKQRFGISKSVTYVWRIHEEVSLEMSLCYTRKREGNSFRFITGGERQPISYRTIFDGLKVQGQGINDTQEGAGKLPPPPAENNTLNTGAPEGNYPR